MTKPEQHWLTASSAIGENEHHFREMIDALPAAIYITDAEGRLTHFNRAAVEFSGREPQLGSDQWCVTWKLYYPDGTPMPHEECPMAAALKEGRSINGAEVIAERPDGKRVWFEAYPSPLRNDEGKIAGGINMLIDITERKQAEKQFRRSEQELTDFFENATIGLHWVGPDGIILRANQAELDLLGYTREEYVGRHIADFHADQDVIEDILRRLKAGEELHDYEARMRCKDGSIRHVLISSNVLWEEDEFIHTRCFTRDVTERKQAEEAVRASEEKYRMLFESMDEGFCIIQVEFDENDKPIDYRHLETNPSFEEQTGLKDIEGKSVRELLPDHEEHWFEIYGKVALTGDPIRFEQRTEALDCWYSLYAFRVGEPQERKVAVIFNDITQRKKNLEEQKRLLREVEAERKKLIDIFQYAPSVMAILRGPDHVHEQANELYKQLMGNRDLIGKPVRQVFPEFEGQGFFELLDWVYETGETYVGTNERVLLKSPTDDTLEEHYMNFVYQPIRDSDGSITGIFTQGVDLTERKQAEEELKAVNETLEERVEERTAALLSYQDQLRSLASELSKAEERERQRLATNLHDNLGQILAIGKMKLDLLQLQRNDLPDRAASGMDELAELMDDAISYTRELMSELKPSLSLDEEDTRASIAWVADKMGRYDLEVTVEDDGQPKPISEEVQTTLSQCVRELLFNVVKHAGVNEARIVLSRVEGQLQVTVEDEGKGFSMKGKEPAPTEEGGFGLFSIHERMGLLGGSLKVVSKPGKGTKMILRVPAKDQDKSDIPILSDEGASTPPPRSSEQPGSGLEIRVLLVDDHRMMREGLQRIIEEEDDLTVVGEASDGEEAVKLAQETYPDVIIMDVNMPGMNGIEATREIISEAPQVRVIGLSFQEEKNVAEAMRSAGASAYLTKSEVFETLCATIRSEAKMAKNIRK